MNNIRFVGEVYKVGFSGMTEESARTLIEASSFLAKELNCDFVPIRDTLSKIPHDLFITRDEITGKIIGVAALEKNPNFESN